jgi:hypothetical protein
LRYILFQNRLFSFIAIFKTYCFGQPNPEQRQAISCLRLDHFK